jgi:hypothetical protein
MKHIKSLSRHNSKQLEYIDIVIKSELQYLSPAMAAHPLDFSVMMQNSLSDAGIFLSLKDVRIAFNIRKN